MERKLREANDLAHSASTLVLPLLIFSLVVTWLLGLESQITPLYLAARKPSEAIANFEKEQQRHLELQKQLQEQIQEKQMRAKELRQDDVKRQSQNLSELIKLDGQLQELEKKRRSINNLNRDELSGQIGEIQKTVKELKSKSDSIDFKLPIIELKIPRIGAPLMWGVVACGSVLYILRLRRRIHRLVKEGARAGKAAGAAKTEMQKAIHAHYWWLHPYPKTRSSPGWPRLPLPVEIQIFWAALTLISLRVAWLGLQWLAFEERDWFPAFFFVLSAGCTAVVMWLLWQWSRSRPGSPAAQQRRQFLGTLGAFTVGATAGGGVLRFGCPEKIEAVAKKIAALRRPHRSSVYDPGRSRHVADTESTSAAGAGAFVRNARSMTVHYLFPHQAYAENKPKKFRKAGPVTKRPNPGPESETFVRWGKAPAKWGAVVANPEDLLLEPNREATEQPHVSLRAAASSFEHYILESALAKGDLPLAIRLGEAAIRHDLSRALSHDIRPNFRIYDLTAGLMVRGGKPEALVALARLIQESPHRRLFADRIAKWLQSDRRWAQRWKNEVAISWADRIISSALLK
ncbi:MAG TPA: hypothetical protein VD994_12335 [Prosthecobacter sp.]|nr:hypothetical protein [Prosthecobacter sp.]